MFEVIIRDYYIKNDSILSLEVLPSNDLCIYNTFVHQSYSKILELLVLFYSLFHLSTYNVHVSTLLTHARDFLQIEIWRLWRSTPQVYILILKVLFGMIRIKTLQNILLMTSIYTKSIKHSMFWAVITTAVKQNKICLKS